MRILMLTPDSFMIDRRILLEAKTLVSHGHRVVLLAGFECAREEHYSQDEIEIHRYKYDWDDERLKAIRRRLPNNDRLRMFVNRAYMYVARRYFEISPFDEYMMAHALEFDFDVVHVHDMPCLKVGVHISRARNVPLVYDAHEIYYAQSVLPESTRTRYFQTEKKYIKSVHTVITVNRFIANLMSERYGIRPPEVLMNCTELPADFDSAGARKRLREKAGLSDDCRVVLFQGWLSGERNIETLVRGARWFPESTYLALIGYGDFQATLEAIACEEGVQEKVRFLGAVPSEQMLNYSAGADLGVIPYLPIDDNHLYCSPNKFFEYVLAGVPVITHDLPFFHEMQRQYGVALTCDMYSPEAFGTEVSRFMGDDGRMALVRANCSEAGHHLNWDEEGKKLLAIYSRIQEDLGVSGNR